MIYPRRRGDRLDGAKRRRVFFIDYRRYYATRSCVRMRACVRVAGRLQIFNSGAITSRADARRSPIRASRYTRLSRDLRHPLTIPLHRRRATRCDALMSMKS